MKEQGLFQKLKGGKFISDFIKIDLSIFRFNRITRFVNLSSLIVNQRIIFNEFNFKRSLLCEATYIKMIQKILNKWIRLEES